MYNDWADVVQEMNASLQSNGLGVLVMYAFVHDGHGTLRHKSLGFLAWKPEPAGDKVNRFWGRRCAPIIKLLKKVGLGLQAPIWKGRTCG